LPSVLLHCYLATGLHNPSPSKIPPATPVFAGTDRLLDRSHRL